VDTHNYVLRMPKELHAEVENLAQRNRRSFNNQILIMLEYLLKKAKKNSHVIKNVE
jgi:hypothetical protein